MQTSSSKLPDRESSATPTQSTYHTISETQRLDAIHAMHVSLLNPRHDNLITAHLARVHASGRRSRVLDVGTGTGRWAINLAQRHPYADVVGVDIQWSHFVPPSPLPHGNVDFFTVDVTKPLPWPADTFDLIHVKTMLMEIPHYPALVRRLAQTLRPGGLLVLVETELSYETALGQPSDAVTTWSRTLRSALAAKDTDVDLPRRLDSAIAATGMFAPQYFFQEVGCPVGRYMKGESTDEPDRGAELRAELRGFAGPGIARHAQHPRGLITSMSGTRLTAGSRTLQKAGQIHASVIRGSLSYILRRRLDKGAERDMLESMVDPCARDLCAPNARYLQRLTAVYAYKKEDHRDGYHAR